MKYFYSSRILQLLLIPFTFLFIAPYDAIAMKISSPDQVRMTLVTEKSGAHDIYITGYSHEIVAPRDAASGLPTGKRQHKPFTVTKEVDKSSPILVNILTNNENITEWRMSIIRNNQRNSTQVLKTVVLTNPSVCAISNTYDSDNASEREHISFCYQKITWSWEDGGITAEDDWETPRI